MPPGAIRPPVGVVPPVVVAPPLAVMPPVAVRPPVAGFLRWQPWLRSRSRHRSPRACLPPQPNRHGAHHHPHPRLPCSSSRPSAPWYHQLPGRLREPSQIPRTQAGRSRQSDRMSAVGLYAGHSASAFTTVCTPLETRRRKVEFTARHRKAGSNSSSSDSVTCHPSVRCARRANGRPPTVGAEVSMLHILRMAGTRARGASVDARRDPVS
jgi:hypothetical protein